VCLLDGGADAAVASRANGRAQQAPDQRGNEVAAGGGFKGLQCVEITGMELTNSYQGFTMLNYGTAVISNSNALGSCLGKG